MKEQEEKRIKVGGITAICIVAVIIVSFIVVNNINVANQQAAERAKHLINGSDARVYRYDANSTYDTYYVTHVLYLDSSKTFNIPLNGQGGLYGHETFTCITLNDTVLASKVNLTDSQLTCVNGTHRIVWGHMVVYPDEYGVFLSVNGTWYEGVMPSLLHANIAIDWALNNTILMETNTTPA